MDYVALRAIVLVSLVICLPLATAGGVGAVTTAVDNREPVALSSGTVENGTNETIPHQNPREYDGERSSLGTWAWLSNDLSERLGNSTVSIGDSEYELAREVIGDEYDQRLEQFDDVDSEISPDTTHDEIQPIELSANVPLSANLGEDVEVTVAVSNNELEYLVTTATIEVGDETIEEELRVASQETEEFTVTLDADDLGEGEQMWSVSVDEQVVGGVLMIDDPEDDEDESEDREKDAVQAFEDAADEQEELANYIEEYRETFEAYEQARIAGDEDRTRELARELESLAERINELDESLGVNYEVIEFETSGDLSRADAEIDEIVDEINQSQQLVRDEQFVETVLEVEPIDETASIVEPAEVTGQVQTTGDRPLANEELQLLVDDEPVTVETDDDGTFTFEYRPTPTTDLESETVSVVYVPDGESPYLGSDTRMDISVEQVDADAAVTMPESSETVAYGDDLTVTGELAVVDTYGETVRWPLESVDDVPIQVFSEDDSLGEVTAENGTFDESVPVPPELSPGAQSITIELALENQALASDEATTTIEVEETPTDIELEAETDDEPNETRAGDELELYGTLETADGDAVANQSVTVELEDGTTTTVTTGPDGMFAPSVSLPSEAAGSELQVVAHFDGDGSNLGDSTDETTVSVPEVSSSGPISYGTVIAIVASLVLLAGVIPVWLRGRPRQQMKQIRHKKERDDGAGEQDEPSITKPTDNSVSALLSLAGERYEEGDTDEAIRIGHTAVRRTYLPSIENEMTLTHWEFYHAVCERTDSESVHERLRRVTEGYERAAFDLDPIPDPVADEVLSDVGYLCRHPENPSTNTQEPADD